MMQKDPQVCFGPNVLEDFSRTKWLGPRFQMFLTFLPQKFGEDESTEYVLNWFSWNHHPTKWPGSMIWLANKGKA